jgi:anthranilate synthase component I
MTFEAYRDLTDRNRPADGRPLIVPVFRRLNADLLTPVSAFLALRRPGNAAFLFESVEGGEKLARYSFLGRDPFGRLTARGPKTDFVPLRENAFDVDLRDDMNIFEALARIEGRYAEVRIPGLPRLTSGAVGYLGYDAVRLLERLPSPPPDELDLPDAEWCLYDTIVAFDHVRHQVVITAATFVGEEANLQATYDDAVRRIDEVARDLARRVTELPESVRLPAGEPVSNTRREDFEAAVSRAREYIHEGDIFQVVLSQRFRSEFEGDPFNLYRALRQVNPSPYLFYLDLGDTVLAGSSPEVLVRVEDGRAEVLPIAGTRRRGATEEEDAALQKELLADPKERAEHLMLVDLGRNDLGRVCRFGSVNVDRYAFVERYSHVMHIVSSVSGVLADRCTAVDTLRACFPAGTVSGAPKVRAMEIIDELEPSRRGVYAGAVGYLDFSGNLDTCIAIRTMVIRGRTVYVQAGAGIVADSDPAAEFEETLNKSGALLRAIEGAAGELL